MRQRNSFSLFLGSKTLRAAPRRVKTCMLYSGPHLEGHFDGNFNAHSGGRFAENLAALVCAALVGSPMVILLAV